MMMNRATESQGHRAHAISSRFATLCLCVSVATFIFAR